MLSITSLYASLLALLVIYLAFKVVFFRRSEKVRLGDNGDMKGMKVIRAHANALENIPMFILLLAMYEINGGIDWVLHALGVVFLLARLIHAFGLSRSSGISFGRFYGTLFTWLSILALSGLNIYNYLF